jgi:hypothetical protein
MLGLNAFAFDVSAFCDWAAAEWPANKVEIIISSGNSVPI